MCKNKHICVWSIFFSHIASFGKVHPKHEVWYIQEANIQYSSMHFSFTQDLKQSYPTYYLLQNSLIWAFYNCNSFSKWGIKIHQIIAIKITRSQQQNHSQNWVPEFSNVSATWSRNVISIHGDHIFRASSSPCSLGRKKKLPILN